ncbi:MAG: bifunctional precorrin-2 dehydrogenase/sirohydrochlorin ferrochelatase [Chloroflexota bacterium]
MNKPVSAYYPVFLNISRRRCLVVGGGQVALRKARALLDCGADVTVVSPDLCPELAQLAESGQMRVINREYRRGDLEGMFLAVAATDDTAANRAVAEEARRSAVLVNAVDDAAVSDFIVPSCLRRGDITIAVSTAGRSPALARKLRTRLEEEFGPEYAALAVLIDEVRAEAKRTGIASDGDGWQQALDLEKLSDLVRRGEGEKARALLLSKLKESRGNG